MKVLAISNLYPPDFIGGYELACAQVVDALRVRGHEVEVLTTSPRTPVAHAPHVRRTMRLTDIWNQYYFQKSHAVTQHVFDAESNFVNAHNVHALLRALDDFQPDVVYPCHLVGLGGLGILACLQYLKIPWVWQLGDRVPEYLCTHWGEVQPHLASEFSRQIRGSFIVVSQRLREEIEACGTALNGKVEVLPNWIHFERPPARRAFYRGGTLKIVSAGRIERIKGIDLLIEAAAKLREAGHEDFSIDIYGKVNDPAFQCLIQKLDVADCVTLKGVLPQPELFRRYGEYDVFAFPTQEREPFGLAPLEAAAFGCVPLISQNCGISEWFVHEVHCLKAARTADAFAAAIGRILVGKTDLEPIARRAAAVVKRDFHLDTLLPHIERMLRDASRQPRDGAGDPDEAYRLALLAEKLTQLLVQESVRA